LLACATLAAASLFAACGEAPPAPPLGLYRAVASTDGGDLPFGLELAREGDATVAYLINGPERVRATNVTLTGADLTVQMPGYQNRIVATFRDGRFEGTLDILRPRGVVKELRLVAVPGETWRFFPKPDAEPLDFSGRWALTYRDADGEEKAAVAEFTQQGHVVNGTVMRASGDDRYLAGEVRGDTLFLSRFDGGTAYLMLARLESDGVLAGEQYTGGGSSERFTGRRDPSAALDRSAGQSALKPGVDRLAFSFPDLDGHPQSYPAERYDGKVVLITVGGSWCANCHDEAEFVIQLMFERTLDFASQAKAARSFAEKFGIDYPVLVAGTISDGNSDVLLKLPQVAAFKAYPTMFVIDRKGVVRAIHTGFAGPATGAHHAEQTRELTELVDSLLAEPG